MKTKFVLGLLIVFLSTCSIKTQTPPNSGVEGQVLIGPVCPVVQAGQECPDQPYQATLTVNSLTGERIAQVRTDDKGRFRIPLATGDYVLHPESSNAMSFAGEQTIHIEDGIFTNLVVHYDSGIR